MTRTIPEPAGSKLKAMGEIGSAWLEGLAALILDLERRWSIRIGGAIAGGSHAYVARAVSAGGGDCVLKIALPDGMGVTPFRHQTAALQAAEGRGYVKLLACDNENRACLLEAMGGPLRDFDHPPEKQMDIICAALRESWASPCRPGLQSGRDIIAWFRDFIRPLWEELGRPCPEAVIHAAYDALDAREADYHPESFVLIHGDAHSGNVLQSPCGGFALIDPDGIWYEKAYDLGVLMREWPDALESDVAEKGLERCQYLCERTGAALRATWQWGFIQSVSTGLLCLKVGMAAHGEMLLRLAAAWEKLF